MSDQKCAGNRILGLNFYFFFQAEDGIRDRLVTGVQTCALPIFVIYQDANVLDLIIRILIFSILITNIVICDI